MEGLITVVIIVISIIGWVTNAINENKQKAQQGGGKKPPQQRNMKNALESFLQELQGEQPKNQQNRNQQNRPQKQRGKKPRSKNSIKNQDQASVSNRKRSSSGHPKHESVFSNEDDRHVGSTDLGQRVSKHAEEHIKSRHVGNLKQAGDFSFEKKKDAIRNSPRTRQHKTSLATLSASQQALELLQSTNSVRAAIILNEILQPPVSQRSKRF